MALQTLILDTDGSVSIVIVMGAWSDYVIVDMDELVMLGKSHLSTKK